MNQREVIRLVLDGKKPPYVPWSFGFTHEAKARLQAYYQQDDLEPIMDNHILHLGSDIGFFSDVGNDCVQDVFGVVWDRSVDKDIGVVRNQVICRADPGRLSLPRPVSIRVSSPTSPTKIEQYGDRFRVFQIGFSLYERAWTLRGMQTLMEDFYDNPGFVDELFRAIADYNMAQIEEALNYDIDAVYFGDDWGQQHGLQMGPRLWRKFIYPEFKRMYGAVRDAGKYVFIHSCGDVDELFDDLIGIGLNCFNPFQPEVMDVAALVAKYRGRLAFHGGLSTQRTLPYGSVADVRNETHRLLALGAQGGYIFAPAHAVEGDVPLENMLAFIQEVQAQR